MKLFVPLFVLSATLLTGTAFAESRSYTCRQGSSVVKLSLDTNNLPGLSLEASIVPDIQMGKKSNQNISFKLGEFSSDGSGVIGSTIVLKFNSGSAKSIQILQLLPGMPMQMLISPSVETVESENPGLKVGAATWPFNCD
jgi:hypothetical protein